MQIIQQIFTIISELFEYSFDFLINLFSGTPARKKGYDSGFASAGTLLSSFNQGFCLTGNRQLSRKNSYMNSMVIGSAGSGKSSAVLVPSIFATRGSFIINDPSGELYNASSNYLHQKGYTVRTLNFSDHTKSSGYNPLERAKTSSDIQKVASLLVENSLGAKGSKDPFWNSQSVSILATLISILKTQEAEYQNLYNVRALLNALSGDPKSVDLLFSKYADKVLYSEYKAFIAYDIKLRTSIIATCKSALQIFMDDEVASVSSHDNLNFKMFREKPTALFIRNSVADQRYFSVITSLFFEQFFSYLMSRFPGKEEQDVFLLIDEASSLMLPTLSTAVANVRKHRAGIMILLQDFNQLIHQYGKQSAEAIKSNCFSRVYFSGQGLDTCKELSELMGKYEYEDKQKRMITRQVMAPDEVRRMASNRVLIIAGNYSPIMARIRPYYKRIRYRKYGNLPPLEVSGQANLGSVEVLPLNHPTTHVEEK